MHGLNGITLTKNVMKKSIVILTLGFLMAFAGTSQAWGPRGECGFRGGYGYRGYGCRPYFRPVVACHPRVWIGPRWGWDRWHRRVWLGGYWR
jgi:hypothetical protein